MSLVNRMLLDLEERQSAPAGAPALAGLSSVDYCVEEERRGRHGRALALAAGAVLAAAVAIIGIGPGSPLSRVSDPATRADPAPARTAPAVRPRPASTPAAEAVAVPPPAETAPVAAPIPSLRLDETLSWLAIASAQLSADDARSRSAGSAAAAAPGRNRVRGIVLTPDTAGVALEVRLDREARYRTYGLESPERIVVEIDGASLDGVLPRMDGAGPVRGVRSRNDRSHATIVLDLDVPASVDGTELVSGPDGAILRVTIAAAGGGVSGDTEAAASTPPVVVPGQLTRAPSANAQIFEDAAARCRAGEVATCLARLSELLTLDPGHVQGRLLFASTLQEHGDAAQAARTLDEGLAAYPGHWQWAQLRAQLAANAGDTARALAVLAASPPAVADSPDYHALLAAVQQRAGRHAEAVRTYHRVLALQPQRGVWWTGLGISLQVLGQDRDADSAFARALADLSLTPELRRFAESRRHMLATGGPP
jgi:MSHA biogenesis protein MshN